MSAEFTPDQKEMKYIGKFKFFCIQNFPFIADDFDQMTYYELLCKIVEYLNKVISNTDNIIYNQEEVLKAYNLLQDYVNDYFDNLDVQEEINNKLDEMVESGEFREIVLLYTKLLRTFSSITEALDEDSLQIGEQFYTLGYYEKNDGGSALYYVRERSENDIEDNGSIFFYGINKVIELIPIDGTINVNQFGAKGQDDFDDTTFIQNALNYASLNRYKVLLLGKTYRISNIIIPTHCVLYGMGWKTSVLRVLPNTNGNIITLNETTNPYKAILKDFELTGYNVECTTTNGIYINVNISDVFVTLENIRISYIKGNGITSYRGRELRFKNLEITRCSGYGFNAQGGSDNQFMFITSSFNTNGGIFANHSGTRWISCKCFGNGDNQDRNGNGFYVSSAQGQTFIGCEAQENLGHGWYINGTKNSNFIGIGADTNGLSQKNNYIITTDLTPISGKDYYTLRNDNTYHCETQYNSLDSFEDGVTYYEKTLSYAGMFLYGTIHNINVELTCNDFRRVEDIDPCQGYGIIFSDSTAYSTFTLHLVNNPVYYNKNSNALKTYSNNLISVNGAFVNAYKNNGFQVTNNPDFNYPAFSIGGTDINDNYNYRFYVNPARANSLKLDILQGSGWKYTPLTISNTGDFSMGTPTGKIGFFGVPGHIKQQSEANANDLASAITLVNNIKAILKNYGLIL